MHEVFVITPTSVVVVLVRYIEDGIASWSGTLITNAVHKSYGPFQATSFHRQPVGGVDYISRHRVGRAMLVQHPNIDQRGQRITRSVVTHATRRGDLLRAATTHAHQIEDMGVAALRPLLNQTS
jgi:hypothetical protein